MKIIDEEGMIFGRINIIDALVVLFVGVLIISGLLFVFGSEEPENTKATEVPEATDVPEFTEVTVSITITDIQPYVAEAIETGRYSENVTITEKSVLPAKVIVRDSEGEFHEREHPVLKTVNLRAKIRAVKVSSGIQYRGQPLRVGREITLDSGRVIVTGTVTDIED